MKHIIVTKNILTENNQILQDFFKDISKYPIIPSEEQINLAKESQKGNLDARNKLINSNLRFVITCAKQYIGQGVPLVDLIQSGIVGLIQSIENYDPEKGYKFLSFAVWYIRREIIKAIYNTGRTIRYPSTYISKITKVKKACDDFETKNQREPSDEELIELTNLSQKQYNSVILNKSNCQSIDFPISEDGKTTVEDILFEEPGDLSDSFTKDAINRCLKVLNSREFKVITWFYGLNGETEHSIKEIAQEMNLGDERVRQLRKNGIKKLKEKQGNILKTLL